MVSFINDLPIEGLSDVMRRLERKTLEEGILTCQKWKSVIEHNFSWSMDLDVKFLSHSTVEILMKTNRNTRKLTLHNYQFDCRQNVVDGLLFIDLLKCFPNLEEVRLSFLDIAEVPEACDLADLKKVEILKLFECDDNVLKSVRTSSLTSLSIKGHQVRTTTSSHVVDFIRRQQNLTNLCLTGFKDMLFEQLCHATPNGTMQFKLAQLKFEVLTLDCSRNWPGLLNFIKIHSNTLQKLKLHGTFSKEIYEVIFGELTNLKFVELSDMSQDTEFGEALKENVSIKNLVVEDIPISPLALRQLCQSVPNVNSLTLWENFDAAKLQIFSSLLSKVTTLLVFNFSNQFNKIRFPNLNSLHIKMVISKVDWGAFTVANSKITEIIIYDVRSSAFNLEHIDTITRNLKLRTLRILSGISADERFLSTISNNCPDLKVLNLRMFPNRTMRSKIKLSNSTHSCNK